MDIMCCVTWSVDELRASARVPLESWELLRLNRGIVNMPILLIK